MWHEKIAIRSINYSTEEDKTMLMVQDDDILKVGKDTPVKKLAGAIAHSLKENEGQCIIQAIGPASINQAVKAFAISREIAAKIGWDLVLIPGFWDVEIDGEKRTAIRLYVEPYQRRISSGGGDPKEEDIIRVAGNVESGHSKSVAGAIAKALDNSDDNKIVMQAVGAAAVNNAIKAICIARGYSASHGHDIICVPGFVDIEIGDKQRTAIRFFVEYR